MSGIVKKIGFQKVIVPLLARSSCMPCIWKQFIWAKAKQIKLANILIVKVVSILETHVQWMVPVSTH